MPGNTEGQRFLPLRALGTCLVIGMTAILVAVCVRAVVAAAGAGDSGPRPWSRLGHGFDAGIDVSIVAWSIVFLVWLWRARADAELLGYRQRRAQGWAFWGWIVPIVSIWFPFQIMRDIWRASQADRRAGPRAWVVPAWWAAWLLANFYVVPVSSSPVMLGSLVPHVGAGTSAVRSALIVTAGAFLMVIIRTVSAGPVGRPPQWAPPAANEPWADPPTAELSHI